MNLNYDLASHHSFGFSSRAQAFMSVDSLSNLNSQLNAINTSAFYILGEGSNTVFLEDYQGTVIKPYFLGIDLKQSESHYLLKVGASENWHQLVIWCMQQQICGFENLALIPGTVGAAPIQNIGAYGVEVERFIEYVEYFDLIEQQHKRLDSFECDFAYRNSIFKNRLAGRALITAVGFVIPKSWQAVSHYGELKTLIRPTAEDIFSRVIEVRKTKLPDPKIIGNAGSFFKNPIISKALFARLEQTCPNIPSYPLDNDYVKVPAAWLIDELGFKGKKVGGIGCHPNQALVLTNDGSGTGKQLLQLARDIKAAVFNHFTIELENEVRLIGKHGPVNL